MRFRTEWWNAVDVLGGKERQVAEGLFRHMNLDGFCFPSEASLAWRLGVSESTVRRGIKFLVENGWIVRLQQPRGKNLPGVRNAYQARIPNSFGALRREKDKDKPEMTGHIDRPPPEDAPAEDDRSDSNDGRSQRPGSPVREAGMTGHSDPLTLSLTNSLTNSGRNPPENAARECSRRPPLDEYRRKAILRLHETYPDLGAEELSRLCNVTADQVKFTLGRPRPDAVQNPDAERFSSEDEADQAPAEKREAAS